MSRRVYLHIGTPKTGTTYLQGRFLANKDALASGGMRYPVGMRTDMFLPALDVVQRRWGGMLEAAEGHWDGLARRVQRSDGNALISHEILAGAKAAQVERVMRDLNGLEIHLVLTARDLGRQIPAEWQEHVKHRGKTSYRRYLKLLHDTKDTPMDRWFWRVQSLPDVMRRWARDIEPERVHVVTVPHRSSGPDELWDRFCRALDLDPTLAPSLPPRANQSMGAAETTMLRRLNKRLRRRLSNDDYRRLVRATLVHERLAQRDAKVPIVVPPRDRDWVEECADLAVEWVEASGVHVVGDVDDLRPRWGDADWQNPDKVRPKLQLAAAMEALEAMTTEAARREDPDRALGNRVRDGLSRLRG